MTPIPISPAAQAALLELAARTGRPATELLDTAVEEFRRHLAALPVASIPGVNADDVWEAASQADAGQLTPHTDVFARLRSRQ